MISIVLNPEYILINDINRIIICGKENDFLSYIHPMHATILTYFDKNDKLSFNEKIDLISEELEINKDTLKSFLNMLVNNTNKVWIGELEDTLCQFPEKVLITKPENYISRNYTIRNFLIGKNSFDNKSLRLNKPLDFTFVINTECFTECIYCYADRKYDYKKNQLSLTRIKTIIQEARQLSMRKIDITGGEFFLHKNAIEILDVLVQNNYKPQISTKIPLNESMLNKISKIGIERLQFSIDCLDDQILQKTIKVKHGYVEKIKKTIALCYKYNIKFKVNTIITKHNCDFVLIDNLIIYLLNIEHFTEITIGVAGCSINNNCNNYLQNLAPSSKEINNLFKSLKQKYSKNVKILIGNIPYFNSNFRFNEDDFFNKAICTGNIQQFYLLPDGKVTLCEELYWHPKFIIGDLSKQSIIDMWNGKRAIDFYNIKSEEFTEDSACKKCDKFDYCHLNASVCWKEVMEAYGTNKWYYPDPRCPKAPKLKINKYIN